MPPCVAHPNFLRKKIYRHSAWTSDARSSVAGTLTLKQCSRVHQNTPFSFRKLKPSLGAYGFRPSRFRRSTFAPFKNSKYTTRGVKNTGLENIGPNSYNRSSTSSTRHPPLTIILCPKPRLLGLHFVADRVGLSSENFTQLALKAAVILCENA